MLYREAALRIEIFCSFTSRTAFSRSSLRSSGLWRGRFNGVVEGGVVSAGASGLIITSVSDGGGGCCCGRGNDTSAGIVEVSMMVGWAVGESGEGSGCGRPMLDSVGDRDAVAVVVAATETVEGVMGSTLAMLSVCVCAERAIACVLRASAAD